MEGVMKGSKRVMVMMFMVLLMSGMSAHGRNFKYGRCDEVYIVEEGETLQTISVKCNTLRILDDNPQIKDTDDIGPGTVLLIRST
ncbi:LysM domain-containing protein [Dioscorea alata]|uniref:LysM domain-containing protein n=1 Tax=Dioscorea alata TaxID=55571 RepID=A0ACB7UTE4_DIOAL|nr:LysM domain-containing protein [Dioscorea alata]